MNRLKELRENKGESKTDVAKVVDVSSMTVARWERGDNSIPSDKAQVLAELFGVSVGHLLGYESMPAINLGNVKIEIDDDTVLSISTVNGQPEVAIMLNDGRFITRKLFKTAYDDVIRFHNAEHLKDFLNTLYEMVG